MANFGKHFKKHMTEAWNGAVKNVKGFMGDADNPIVTLALFGGAILGLCAYGWALGIAPLLTLGFAAVAGAAGVAFGHIKDPGHDAPYAIAGAASPIIITAVATAGLVTLPLTALSLLGKTASAVIKSAIDSAQDNTKQAAEKTLSLPVPSADAEKIVLPAPATKAFSAVNQNLQQDEQGEILRIHVERVNKGNPKL